MGNEIKENIVTRVKKELGISDAVDDLALYEFLCKTLIENHPDKFSDREHKDCRRALQSVKPVAR